MCNPPGASEEDIAHLRAVLANIWFRARVNAFAHRVACESARRIAAWMFGAELFATLLSILGIISVYLITSDGQHVLQILGMDKTTFSLPITFASICFTLASLFISVMANYLKLDVRAESHAFIVGSYQYIEQRARESAWRGMAYAELVELLKELQRNFQLIKARNMEPADRHFEIANTLYKKISEDPLTASDRLRPDGTP